MSVEWRGQALHLFIRSARAWQFYFVHAIGVRIKQWIEMTRSTLASGSFFRIGKPFQVVAKVEPVH
jgi:hypothetical protein